MDTQTIDVYNQKAASIAARHRHNPPNTTHDYALAHFQVGELTADIGCGSGRDTEWLHRQGYPTVGFDGSEGMLGEARRLYPTCKFATALLPNLDEIPDSTYRNVLCNAVLMHLPLAEVAAALRHLARILQPAGRIVLTFRPTQEAEEREQDGRSFTRIPLNQMHIWAGAAGLNVLHAETLPDPVRTDGHWHIMVAEKEQVPPNDD